MEKSDMRIRVKEIEAQQQSLRKEQERAAASFNAQIHSLENAKKIVLANYIETLCPFYSGDVVIDTKGDKYEVTSIVPLYSGFSDLCGFTVYGKKMNKKGLLLSINENILYVVQPPRIKIAKAKL